jgi:RyR domain
MSPARSPLARDLRFIVAGHSRAVGVAALQISRSRVGVKLVRQAASAAAAIAEEGPVEIFAGQVSLPNLLHRAGAALATHLVLFPSDLSEMFRMLNAALQTYDFAQAGTPLRVFAFLPNRSAAIAVRQNGLVFPRDSRLRLQLLSMAEDAASDLVFEHFGKNAGGSEGFNSSQFIVLGSGPVAEAVATKLARLGGGLANSKTSVDWILPHEVLNGLKTDYARFEDSGALRLHGPRNPESLLSTLRFLPATALILVACDPSHNFEILLASSESFDLNRLYRIYVSDPYADEIAGFMKSEFDSIPGLNLIRAFGGWSRSMSLTRFLEIGRFGLPKALHADYCDAMAARGRLSVDHPSLRPWEELSEDLRRANVEQADHITYKLSLLGYQVEPLSATAGETPPPSLSAREVETLARLEHARWLIDRQLAGWTFGQIRDNELKRHPMIIPFNELPEEEKEKDYRAARNIPRILRRAGLGIRKL